MASIIRKIR